MRKAVGMMDLDEHNPTDIWEPYQLELGAVVRIRLSGECSATANFRRLTPGGTFQQSIEQTNHPNIYDNKLGVVMQIDRSPKLIGHHYTVFLIDAAFSPKYGDMVGADFAHVELELVKRHLTKLEWTRVKSNAEMFLDEPIAKMWKIIKVPKDNSNELFLVTCCGTIDTTICTCPEDTKARLDDTWRSTEKS